MNVCALFLSMNFFLPYAVRMGGKWTYHEKNDPNRMAEKGRISGIVKDLCNEALSTLSTPTRMMTIR